MGRRRSTSENSRVPRSTRPRSNDCSLGFQLSAKLPLLQALTGGVAVRCLHISFANTGCSLTSPNCAASCRPKCPVTWCRRLSCYMDALPRTPNGKIDRQSLPASDGSRSDLDVAFVASRTPTEQAWKVFGINCLTFRRSEFDDSFFDLGGHSVTVAPQTCIANSRHLPRRYADRVDLHRADHCMQTRFINSNAGGPCRTREVGDTSTKDGRPMPPLICATENLVSRSVRTGQPRVQLPSRVPPAW